MLKTLACGPITMSNSYIKKAMLPFQALLQGYLEAVKQAHVAIYRVVKLPDNDDHRIHFQIVGEDVFLKMLPEEIMRDDMLMGFSKADIAVITHLGTKKEESKKKAGNIVSRIVRQIFGKKGKTQFLIENHDQDELVAKTPLELYHDESTKSAFSVEDALKIGYTAAQEYYQSVQDEVNSVSYRLVAQETINGEILLRYELIESGAIVKESLEAVFYNAEKFLQFSTVDRQVIAFAAGELAKAREHQLRNN